MNQKGQALISILLIMSLAVLVVSSALVSTSLSKTAGISTESDRVLYSAETGVEEALIKLLRDPNYQTDSFTIDGVLVNIKIQIGNPNPNQVTIKSEALADNLKRTVEVLATFEDNILTITNWKQVP